jgi:hypothetical protein
VRSLAPWLWLVDFDAQRTALDASERPTGELAAELSAHFAEVHIVRTGAAILDEIRVANRGGAWLPSSEVLGSVRTAAWPRETFDCIALHDALVRRQLPTAEVLAELQDAHRLLKPGGWLALTSSFPRTMNGARTRTPGIPRAILSRLLTRAHFEEIRCLFVHPGADEPFTLVPNVKTAIRAHEACSGGSGVAMWRRRMAVELGVQSALFPAYVLLARA